MASFCTMGSALEAPGCYPPAGFSDIVFSTALQWSHWHAFALSCRGTVIGILKAFLGLSASAYITIYVAFIEPDAIKFLKILVGGCCCRRCRRRCLVYQIASALLVQMTSYEVQRSHMMTPARAVAGTGANRSGTDLDAVHQLCSLHPDRAAHQGQST